MRGFKRLMAAVFALVMVMSMTMSAFAADIPEGESVPSVGHYEITGITDELLQDVPDADKDAIKGVEQGASTEDFANAITATGAGDVKAALEGKEWLTPFFDLHAVGGAPQENLDNKPIHIHVPGISSYAKGDISIIHYSLIDKKWQVLNFEFVPGENDVVAVTYHDLSPTGIAVVVKSKSDDSGSSSSSSSKKSSSPKTGMETGWEMFALAGVALALCGASFSRKKRA